MLKLYPSQEHRPDRERITLISRGAGVENARRLFNSVLGPYSETASSTHPEATIVQDVSSDTAKLASQVVKETISSTNTNSLDHIRKIVDESYGGSK